MPDIQYHKIFNYNTITVGIYVCKSVHLSICILNVRQSVICLNCYNTKNLSNYAFVCLLKGIFVVKCKISNCRISGQIFSISSIRPDRKSDRIPDPTLEYINPLPLPLNKEYKSLQIEQLLCYYLVMKVFVRYIHFIHHLPFQIKV